MTANWSMESPDREKETKQIRGAGTTILFWVRRGTFGFFAVRASKPSNSSSAGQRGYRAALTQGRVCPQGLAAKLAAEAGFDAIWGSGFELSASYAVPDANILPMGAHLEMMRAIGEVQVAPVIADLDTGFGNAINVTYVVPRRRHDQPTRVARVAAIRSGACLRGVTPFLCTPSRHLRPGNREAVMWTSGGPHRWGAGSRTGQCARGDLAGNRDLDLSELQAIEPLEARHPPLALGPDGPPHDQGPAGPRG